MVDFRFTPAEDAFRAEIKQFIKENMPKRTGMPVIWAAEDIYSEDELWELHKTMARKFSKNGWLTRAWPKELGGQAASAVSEFILIEELAYGGCPGKDPVGLGMLAHALIKYGTEAQKKQHLGAMARGEEFWCEGLSEPNSGSDLASLTTRAVDKGDHFLMNGQKVWTTGAHRADWCFVLARTDPEASKHKGLSLILVDMKSPGITPNPLLGMSGGRSLNEVFFSDVKVPKENLVGQPGQGWFLANTILTSERSLLIELVAVAKKLVEMLGEYLKQQHAGLKGTPQWARMKNRLAEVAIEAEVARWLAYRLALLQDKGAESDVEAGISKLFSSELLQHTANAGMEILGHYGPLVEGSKWAQLHGAISHWYLSSIATTLFGGTSEIQRTVIALRGLGMPRDLPPKK